MRLVDSLRMSLVGVDTGIHHFTSSPALETSGYLNLSL